MAPKKQPAPPPQKKKSDRAANPPNPCLHCRITSANLSTAPLPDILAVADISADLGFAAVRESTPNLSISLISTDPNCPCHVRAYLNYIRILVATKAKIYKRSKSFQFPQLIYHEPIPVPNQYIQVAQCTINISISQLNDDFRSGLVAPFSSGVLESIDLYVSCNSREEHIVIALQ